MAFNNRYLSMMPPVTKNLLIINVLIFVVMMVIPASKCEVLYNYLSLHYFASPAFNPAQLFTYMFMHGGFMHLFFNMFALFMFGPMIEWALGSRRFLFYYISCGVGAALIQEGVYAIMVHQYSSVFSPAEYEQIVTDGYNALRRGMNFVDADAAALNYAVNGTTVGASGAIYGILLAFGMLFPNREIMLVIPPMPIKAKWMVAIYAVIELLFGLGANDNVAHFCHLGGMLFGLLMILYWKKKGTFHGYY